MEIERKWLFDSPDIAKDKCELYERFSYLQGYISITPEIRISRKWSEGFQEYLYKLTIKSKDLLSRIEVEKALNSLEFLHLMTVGGFYLEDMITKTIYDYIYQGYHLTIGIVDEGQPTSFCYGEIEFSSEEEANAFIAPDWFGKEVTYDKSYKMSEYWKRTRLEENKL